MISGLGHTNRISTAERRTTNMLYRNAFNGLCCAMPGKL